MTAPVWILESAGESGAHVLRLSAGVVKTVGRGARADFIVEAPLVSRVHCRFCADPSGQLVVEDLESTNGTSVNGARVDRAVLKPGDTVTIGRLVFSVARQPPA